MCAAGFDDANVRRVLLLGDSKTALVPLGNTWPADLTSALNSASAPLNWILSNKGLSGATVAGQAGTTILANLMDTAGDPSSYVAVLVNLGVNDGIPVTEATWKANYQDILTAIHAKLPSALVYLTRPWKTTGGTHWDTIAAYIDDLVAANAFARLGDDERVWLKGSDNGATNTSDGTHYSAAGEAAAVTAKKTVLGY